MKFEKIAKNTIVCPACSKDIILKPSLFSFGSSQNPSCPHCNKVIEADNLSSNDKNALLEMRMKLTQQLTNL